MPSSALAILAFRHTFLNFKKVSQMPNLKRLDLDKNYLTGLPANLFENNPDLQFANFLNNRIRAVPESLFAKNPNLEVVWFSGNMVSILSSF